jgi:biofilm PGA synthesis N-glycosyltransferase PgaC
MGAPAKGSRYVLVSPIKDEEKYVETTLRAVLNQTVRPLRWVLVDDGSRDRTHEILESYARRVDWLTIVTIRRDAARQPGSGIIRAFNEGFQVVQNEDFDFVVKLDCDIDLPPTYFENLIEKFRQDPRLGIASGIFFEFRGGQWTSIAMPPYHAAGQTKIVRMSCFLEIGGFAAARGWDSFDEIKAQAAGWNTRHFRDIQFYHLKLEGSGIGFLRTSMMHGEIYYMTGGGPLFFTLKWLHYAFTRRPFVLGSLMLLAGYLRPLLARKRKLVSRAEERLYRSMLNRRIVDALSDRLALRRLRGKELAA